MADRMPRSEDETEPRFSDAASFVGAHPSKSPARHMVAPTTDEHHNTLRFPILAVACFRLNDVLFDFGSSFVRPEIRGELRRLADQVRAHAGAPAAIFGHADPTGEDGTNKVLGGRRAAAIYGLLVRDVALWSRLFDQPVAGDQWGVKALSTMLGHLQKPSEPSQEHVTMALPTSVLPDAIRSFQQISALPVTGTADSATRSALFRAYMDAICLGADDPFVMESKDFVGEGADESGKGALQGCGEHNPVLLFSQAEVARHAASTDKRERDARNAPNRRVVLFLLRPETKVALAKWPCPRWDEGAAGCLASFWPDGQKRRTNGAKEREYRVDRHTMACRFYDRLARTSPCEGIAYVTLRVRLFDRAGEPMPGVAFKLIVGDRVEKGNADGHALATVHNVIAPNACVLSWSPARFYGDAKPPEGEDAPFEYEQTIFVEANGSESTESVRERLTNLGYSPDAALDACVSAFQQDYDIKPVNGDPEDPATRQLLFQIHIAMTPDPRLGEPAHLSLFDAEGAG